MFANSTFRRPVLVAGLINAAVLLLMVAAEVLLVAAAESARDPSRVVIKDFTFAPADLSVTPGTTVTWVNQDEAPHTIVGDDKAVHSGALDTGDQFQYVFASPGTYTYHCSLHPQMTGRIIVR